MKDIKFKIFASALASVLLVGCNDLDTEPLGAVVTSDQKEEVVKNDPEMVSASVTGITAMYMAMPYPLLLDTTTSVMVQLC